MVIFMFSGVEFVRAECKRKGISIAKLEKDLCFSNGYLNPRKLKTIPYDRAKKIAAYLDVDYHLVLGDADQGDEEIQQPYYYNDAETAKVAQAIFDDHNLHALFDAARDSKPEDLKMAADLLMRLKGTNIDG